MMWWQSPQTACAARRAARRPGAAAEPAWEPSAGRCTMKPPSAMRACAGAPLLAGGGWLLLLLLLLPPSPMLLLLCFLPCPPFVHLSHVPAPAPLYLCHRVGWSSQAASLDLGTDKGGFGFGGTGMRSNNRQFEKYGEVGGWVGRRCIHPSIWHLPGASLA